MKTLETERLILRKFRPDDFAAVQSYAGVAENTIYMIWGPNTEGQTRAFIDMAIRQAEENPCTKPLYAAVLKKERKLIGSCNLSVTGDEAEIGWILHRDYWKRGYGPEMGFALLELVFDGFIDLPALSDGEIRLVCTEKKPAAPERKYVPEYVFLICKGSEKVGAISLQIGYTDGLYYGGQIGYGIDEARRGNGYAGRACRLLLPVARAHGMRRLLICCNPTNTASIRVCEKLGARLLRTARLPEWHALYRDGRRFENIFEWNVE